MPMERDGTLFPECRCYRARVGCKQKIKREGKIAHSRFKGIALPTASTVFLGSGFAIPISGSKLERMNNRYF